jgi:hypothetical protein
MSFIKSSSKQRTSQAALIYSAHPPACISCTAEIFDSQQTIGGKIKALMVFIFRNR